jgi:hypothetical protein
MNGIRWGRSAFMRRLLESFCVVSPPSTPTAPGLPGKIRIRCTLCLK